MSEDVFDEEEDAGWTEDGLCQVSAARKLKEDLWWQVFPGEVTISGFV